jgi:preprotein translocase subunit SecD
MARGNKLTLVFIALIVGFVSWVLISDRVDLPGMSERDGFPLGLDLRGGVNLEYQADFSDIPEGERSGRLAETKRIIEKRIDKFGVTEPIIQIMGSDRISVQLPGVTDIPAAKDLVGKTAELVFREQATQGNTLLISTASAGDTQIAVAAVTDFAEGDVFGIGFGDAQEMRTITAVNEDSSIITADSGFDYDHAADEPVTNLWVPATGILNGEKKVLTGIYLKPNSYVDMKPYTGEPVVAFEWEDEGAELFSQITGRLIGEPLGIFLDNELISSPVVQSQISDKGIIEGLTFDDAERLTIQLNTGALPVPLEIVREQTVSAILGEESLDKSLVAGGVGLALVLLFMILYYRIPGVLAGGALVIYGGIVLSVFKLIPVTLTLAHIAGLILSIGMAVDANVLIFERMKEEIRAGKGLKAAIETGFQRAWPSIRDSNVSTIIICLILWWFGSRFGAAPVTGFAITLLIGVSVSMFTAMIITRAFLRSIVLTPLRRRVSLFRP